jgi:hypothetical protein
MAPRKNRKPATPQISEERKRLNERYARKTKKDILDALETARAKIKAKDDALNAIREALGLNGFDDFEHRLEDLEARFY